MTQLFGRTWYLSVGSLDLTDLDLSFSVKRSVRREPNLAEIRVWNLNRQSRTAVEAGGTVVLRVGLGGPATLLFRGDSRVVYTEADGVDGVTLIQARDGGRAYSDARLSRSYGAGTRVVTVLRDLVEAMGIGEGNLADFEASYQMRNGATTFASGYVVAGPTRRVMNDITRAAGLRWSVQNGALQLMRQGVALQTRSVVLSAGSGLVGPPTWADYRTRRLVRCVSLIQPGLDPGRKVRLESESITGDFEIRTAEYTGDTRGNEWYCAMELRPVT